jgi:hypothetical protein
MYFFGITNFFETMFYAAITLFIHGEKNMYYMANRKINKHNMNLNCSSIFCGEIEIFFDRYALEWGNLLGFALTVSRRARRLVEKFAWFQ